MKSTETLKMIPMNESEIEELLNSPEFGQYSDEEVQAIKDAEREFAEDNFNPFTISMNDIFNDEEILY